MAIIVALFWSLVHSIWQGLALHVVARLVAARSRSAPQRYVLLCSAQLALLLAFVSTLLRELSAGSAAEVIAWPAASGARVWLPALMLGIVAAWGAGLLWMTVRLVHAFHDVSRLRQSAAALLGWQSSVERTAARLGLRRAVAIVEAMVDSPLTLGWLRPVLLLPIGWAAQLPPQVVEAAILHELMHVRRHDYLVNVAQQVVEAMFFFHPSVHWLSRQVRAERELCCDEAVVDAHLDPLDYAAALVALEQQRWPARLGQGSSLGLAVARGELSARVEHVLSRRGTPHPEMECGLGAGIAALTLLVVAGLGACLGRVDARNQEQQNRSQPAIEEGAKSAALQAPLPPVGPRWLPQSVSRYGEAIEVAAAAHGLDPALVALVVLVESQGNPNVDSPAGAVGLMEIMPVTAAHIAAERGLPAPTLAQLREPAFNLDFGAYFLAQLLASGARTPSAEQVRLAAIGYNGGRDLLRNYLAGHASLWPETERYSSLLSQLWSERDAESSAAYRTLQDQ
jgi:beta-lactamase regulating signal transducer with metallopeptidase domain